MSSGSPRALTVLHGFRRNERRLGRWALGLFFLVWLQLAAAPCRAVHAMPAEGHPHGHAHRDVVAGVAHEAHAAVPDAAHGDCGDPGPAIPEVPANPAGQGNEPCPWCPSNGHGGDHDGGSRCAFPHGPQVDSRLPPPFLPSPVAATFPSKPPLAGYVLYTADERPDAVPRRSYSVSYCRYIE